MSLPSTWEPDGDNDPVGAIPLIESMPRRVFQSSNAYSQTKSDVGQPLVMVEQKVTCLSLGPSRLSVRVASMQRKLVYTYFALSISFSVFLA